MVEKDGLDSKKSVCHSKNQFIMIKNTVYSGKMIYDI